jgi:2-polyprenyl-3-methyl-5-hydroxy-6-metoxy-1,4-benzoquinol methylase
MSRRFRWDETSLKEGHCSAMRRTVKWLLGLLRRRRGPQTAQPAPFDYKEYWNERYRSGGDSGSGSYGDLAQFKADYIHAFLAKHPVESVLEFGCGDGNQLGMMRYPRYLGLDVSEVAVKRCAEMFRQDETKRFLTYTPGTLRDVLPADLVLCLDVLYHITDDAEFRMTLQDIFSSSSKYVILYTSLEKPTTGEARHVRSHDLRSALREFPEFSERDVTRCPFTDLSSASFILLARDSAVPPEAPAPAANGVPA